MSTLVTADGPAVEPLDERGSAVRFDSQCVVIPDLAYRSRLPRVVTKSYTLPLWRRRSSSATHSTPSPPEDNPFEESHLVLRVPLPTLSLKPHSAARSVDHPPLPPCLIHRPSRPSGPSHAGSPPSLPRSPRTPRRASPSPSRPDVTTVPLRPCCAACQPITEAAFVDGDAWTVRFSRAASRRRTASADSGHRTITVAGSAASASYAALGLSINVDEIDKRRRSSDIGPFTASRDMLWSDDTRPQEQRNRSSMLRCSPSANSAVVDAHSPPSPARVTPATPRIPEEEDDEDENELFPLPSPKRTPTPSPAQSPAGSLSSLVATHGSQNSSTCSGDSVAPHPNKRRDFLAPPPCSSSSSLSLPKLSDSATNLTLPEDFPRVPSPNLLSDFPSLSGRPYSRSPSPRISFIPPTPTDGFPSPTDSSQLKTTKTAGSVRPPSLITVSPRSDSSKSPNSPQLSPRHPRFMWRSKRSFSEDASSLTPTVSPTSSPQSLKKTFSISRHVIADVLRGVGAAAAGGIGPGI